MIHKGKTHEAENHGGEHRVENTFGEALTALTGNIFVKAAADGDENEGKPLRGRRTSA
jgi:hypothetical protein